MASCAEELSLALSQEERKNLLPTPKRIEERARTARSPRSSSWSNPLKELDPAEELDAGGAGEAGDGLGIWSGKFPPAPAGLVRVAECLPRSGWLSTSERPNSPERQSSRSLSAAGLCSSPADRSAARPSAAEPNSTTTIGRGSVLTGCCGSTIAVRGSAATGCGSAVTGCGSATTGCGQL